MDDKKTSSWDDLIKDIGASPAPDALERKRPAIETTFNPPPIVAAPPKPKASDWGGLASQPGIQVPPEPPPPPKPKAETTRKADPKPTPKAEPKAEPKAKSEPRTKAEPKSKPESKRSSSRAAKAERHEPTPGELESSFAGIEPLESSFEEIIEAEIVDVDYSDEHDSDLADEYAAQLGDDALSGDAARNAFDALFEGGEFSPPPPKAPRPPKPREPSARR